MIRFTRFMISAAVLLAAAAFGGSAQAADATAGKTQYDQLCFSCHGFTGKGDGPAGAALQPPPRDFSAGDFLYDADGNGTPGEDADLSLIIKNGAATYGGNPMMAPWGYLGDEAIADIVAYVRTLKVEN